MSDLKIIDIKIADRSYPLKVKPEQENQVKLSAERINSQLKDLKEKYAARDMQDYLAMILLLQMNAPNQPETIVNIDFSEQLNRIENQLSELLK